jgi:23S rRNA (adenine1618-N6)-methyltransferase
VHPDNPFLGGYDFDKLILSSSDLAQYVFVNQYGTKTIQFSDQNAVKSLNTALLKNKYAINWRIPKNNLCPPIPGRLDYLLHVKDLIDEEIGVKEIFMLDIGTGANLIYPILGTCHFNWKCVGSDINKESLKNAQAIIEANDKLSCIELLSQDSTDKIFNNIIHPNHYFDVVVCNPPFFKNSTDAEKNNLRKVKNLKLTATERLNFGGLDNELWCKGGEEEFVKKMAIESVNFKTQVHWFTALISNKEHLKNIKRTLNKLQATHVKVVDMEQGNKMSRFIAWTFKTES